MALSSFRAHEKYKFEEKFDHQLCFGVVEVLRIVHPEMRAANNWKLMSVWIWQEEKRREASEKAAAGGDHTKSYANILFWQGSFNKSRNTRHPKSI